MDHYVSFNINLNKDKNTIRISLTCHSWFHRFSTYVRRYTVFSNTAILRIKILWYDIYQHHPPLVKHHLFFKAKIFESHMHIFTVTYIPLYVATTVLQFAA